MPNSKSSWFLTFVFWGLVIYWGHGYWIERGNGQTSLPQYLKENIKYNHKRLSKFNADMITLVNETIKGDDKVKRGAIELLAKSVEVFQAENERYPKREELVGLFTDNREILKDPSLEYSVSEDGKHFEASIKLKSGEVYTIKK